MHPKPTFFSLEKTTLKMNQYHIYEKIGKGKYSTVYKGRRKKTISYYAIKSVDKSQKARVLQEVRGSGALLAGRKGWACKPSAPVFIASE